MREEDKSYAAHFLVASAILLVAAVWTIRREAVDLRPWKGLQRAYYAYETERLGRELGETRARLDAANPSTGFAPLAHAASASAPNPASRSRLVELERSLREIEQAPISIQQVYVPKLGLVDRCKSCHIGIERPDPVPARQPFAAHPGRFLFLDRHPTDRFGCTPCHQGQGRGTSSVAKAHGRVAHWDEPLLAREHTSASCLKCHGEHVESLRGASTLAEGRDLVRRYGCYGCHAIPGYDSLPRPGPPLGKVGEKINYSYLVRWIKSPRTIVADARMPDFGFTDDEARAIGDFLTSFTRGERVDVRAAQFDSERVAKGKELYASSRCSICHRVEERGGAFAGVYAPDLTVEGSKIQSPAWIADRIQEPAKYVPDTVMPRFRLSDAERRQIAAYIAGEFVDVGMEEAKLGSPQPITRESVERGRALVQKFGCFGCHAIPGFEKEGKIGADLGRIGRKSLERFDFSGLDIPHERSAWLRRKLEKPRGFRGDVRMPDYHMTADEVRALATFLLGLTGEELPPEFTALKAPAEFVAAGAAGKLIADLKCLTCHSIRGRGGKFAPELGFEGSAVERSWLIEFLKAPDLIRPLLEQMPKFNLTDQEAAMLADYITMTLTDPRVPDDAFPADAASVRGGARTYERSGCRSCHQKGNAGGALGPNLTSVGRRLTAGYLLARTRDARAFRPAIVEPHYGFSEDQAAALAAFLKAQRQSDVAKK